MHPRRAERLPVRQEADGERLRFPRHDPLISLFKVHQHKQEAERQVARQLWQDKGYVFTKLDGNPLNPNTDYHEWTAPLTALLVVSALQAVADAVAGRPRYVR